MKQKTFTSLLSILLFSLTFCLISCGPNKSEVAEMRMGMMQLRDSDGFVSGFFLEASAEMLRMTLDREKWDSQPAGKALRKLVEDQISLGGDARLAEGDVAMMERCLARYEGIKRQAGRIAELLEWAPGVLSDRQIEELDWWKSRRSHMGRGLYQVGGVARIDLLCPFWRLPSVIRLSHRTGFLSTHGGSQSSATWRKASLVVFEVKVGKDSAPPICGVLSDKGIRRRVLDAKGIV